MSENKDSENGSDGVDSDSRGQGNTRYIHTTNPSSPATNGLVLVLQ